jgi:hypothetical protein
MARQLINNTPADSGLGDTLKVAFDKVNAMTLELYATDSSFGDAIDLINTTLATLNDDTSLLYHKHAIYQIQGLQAALNSKVSSSTYINDMMAVTASIQAINDSLSDIIVILNSKVEEAPFSGITYGRRDGAWVQITGGTGGSQSLGQTLLIGNYTDGTNIIVDNTDAIELKNGSLLKKGTYDFGGNGGISRICSVGYEDMWQSGFRHVFDNNGFIRNSTNCFDIVPDASFDDTLRFKIGSRWTLDNGDTYECSDATTGAAVWSLVTIGNTGNFVPYTGGTKDVVLSANSITANDGFQSAWTYGQFQVGIPTFGIESNRLFSFNTAGDNVDYAATTQVEISASLPSGIFMRSNTDILDEPVNTKTSQLSIQGDTAQLASSFEGNSNAFTIFPTFTESNQKVVSNGGFQSIFQTGYGYFGTQFSTANRQFNFLDTGDGIEFYSGITVQIAANVEEACYMLYNDDRIGGSSLYVRSNILFQSSDLTNTNEVQIDSNQLSTNKKIFTGEGFEGNYVQFNTAASETSAVGKLKWNDTDGTLDLGLKGGNVTLQIGQEQLVRVVNKTATNITLQESAYQAVRVTGAQGQRLKVDLALATNDLNSAETIGLVTETILNNQEGFVTTSGLVNKINTTGSLQGETWADGDTLYLSPTVAGRITNIKPSAPNHLVIIGYVVYAHVVNGKIYVKVDNGYELDELHNVSISAATNNQVLTYESATGLWKNKDTASAFTGGTVSGPTRFTNGLTANTFSATSITTPTISASSISATTINTINIVNNDIDYLMLTSFRTFYSY